MQQQQLLTRLGIAGATSVLIAQPAIAEMGQVSNVRLNPTKSGVEVILESPDDGGRLQVFSSSYGRTFIAHVTNARLRLPEGSAFTQENPSEGIASVTVSQLYPNTVGVKVIGKAGVSTTKVIPGEKNLILSVSAPGDATTTATPSNLASTKVLERTPTTPTTPTTPESELRLPNAQAQRSQAIPTIPTTPESELRSPIAQAQGSQTTPTTPTTPPTPTTPTAQDEEDDVEDIEVVVTATRRAESLNNVPRSVTVITRQELEQQATGGRDVQDILGNSVPGLGAPSQLQSSFGQSLRGRAPQVLIDGVPVSSNNSTAFARDLRSIDPAAIERIEVVRGASAAYGGGATGGVINIITRRPTQSKVTYTTEVEVSNSLTRFEDTLGYNLQQLISGKEGQLDYTASISLKTTGDFFDAQGDRIALADSGTQDTQSLNILSKVGLDVDENQRVQLSVNHLTDRQAINFISDPVVDEIPGRQKARALGRELSFLGTGGPGNLNTVVTLDYNNRKIFGSQVQAQVFYANTENRGAVFDNRQFFEESIVDVARTRQASERLGGRLQIDTPLAQTVSLLWGLDYSNETNSEIFDLFDTADYDNNQNRTLSKTGERVYAPPHRVNSLGLFAQGQWDVSDRLQLSGGLRQERIGFSVGDYNTADLNNPIIGGNRDFSATVFNAGAVYRATNQISLFTNFSQGFSIPALARVLYSPPAGFAIERDLQITDPQKVNNYEIGVRGNWQTVQASLSAFYNTSDSGANLETLDIGRVELVRAPQRNYGIEATVDVQPITNWRFGGILSWTEGENDADQDGKYLALSTNVIQPLKLTAYVENQTSPGWRNRLQALYVGNRDRAFNDQVDVVPISSYLTLDYISSIRLGRGDLQIGVQNLLNNQYYPAINQWLGGFSDTLYVGGRGRSLSVGYKFTW